VKKKGEKKKRGGEEKTAMQFQIVFDTVAFSDAPNTGSKGREVGKRGREGDREG